MEVETTPDEEKAASTGGNQEAAKSEPPLAPPITALGTGKRQPVQRCSCRCPNSNRKNAYVCSFDSARREPQEAVNVLVLCGLLHRLV